MFPDEHRLLYLRRNQAAERAIAELRNSAAEPWSVVCRYLHERYDFAVEDATPREVARFLKRRGFALERCTEGEAFLRACDASRYTGAAPTASAPLIEEAIRLIQALEADPCAH
jgi:hypothetical protein